MLPPGRALAMVLAVLLLAGPALLVAGPALAQNPTVDPPEEPEPPPGLACEPPLGECLPDLLPTNPEATSGDETQPVTICTDFINLGETPTATSFRVLLTLDEQAVGERQFSDVYETGHGENDVCWEDIRLARGRHSFRVTVDAYEQVAESNESNNVRVGRFHVGPPPTVDLELTSLVITPREGATGTVQLFIANISNVGSAGSPPTTLLLDDDNGMRVEWPVPSLAPGQTLTRVHATRPDIRPVGTFYVRGVIDPSDTVVERDEENNELLRDYVVLDHPAPDYVIENITIHGNLSEMRGIRVDAHVKNVGDRAVAGTTVFLVNETRTVVAFAGTRSLLYPGQTSTVQFILALPAGEHAFRLIADPTRIVPERNESNNFHWFNLTIVASPVELDRPNLVIDRIYATPTDPIPGRDIVGIGALIHNIGTNLSNETTVEFRVNGERVASAVVPRLDPGEMHSAYVPWAPPDYAAYGLLALADPDDKVLELDEGDNAIGMDFLVTTDRPPEDPLPPTQPPQTPPRDPATPDPTPTTPTSPTPPTTTPPANATPSIVVGELIVETSKGPDGARGIISVSLRNPSIQPVGSFSVTFKVDGEPVRELLYQGIRGAATAAATTGQIDIPAGTHTASAEVRILGTTVAPVIRELAYTQDGPDKGIPGVQAAFVVLAVSVAVLLRRRKHG